MKRKFLIVIALEIVALIALIIVLACIKPGTPDDPINTDSTSTQDTTPPPTDDTQGTTDGTQGTTAPPEQVPSRDLLGKMYSMAELEAMDTESNAYGPGTTSDGKQPPYAQDDQKKYGQYGAKFIMEESNKIYLTFDCGYEYSFQDENGKTVRVTEWILDTLKEKEVKGVFFVTMPYCEKNPDLVQRMIDEGHTVGNHSNHHPNSMAKLTIAEMVEEVMTLHDYVKEHFGYDMRFFRPPTGAFSQQSLAVVQSLGYESVFWSFAHADWDPENQPTVDKAMQTITGRHHGGAIYLLHAVSATNATVLPDVIDWFRAQGYTLELLPYSHSN